LTEPIGFPSEILNPRESPHRHLTPKKGLLKRPKTCSSSAADGHHIDDHPNLPLKRVHFFHLFFPDSNSANCTRTVHSCCLVTGRFIHKSPRTSQEWRVSQELQRQQALDRTTATTPRTFASVGARQRRLWWPSQRQMQRYYAERRERDAERELLKGSRPPDDQPEKQRDWDVEKSLEQAKWNENVNRAHCPLSMMKSPKRARKYHPAILGTVAELVALDVRRRRQPKLNQWARNVAFQEWWKKTGAFGENQFQEFRLRMLKFVEGLLFKGPSRQEGFTDDEVVSMAFSVVIFLAYNVRPFMADTLLDWQYQYLKQQQQQQKRQLQESEQADEDLEMNVDVVSSKAMADENNDETQGGSLGNQIDRVNMAVIGD